MQELELIRLLITHSDIIKGLVNSEKPSISGFIKGLPDDLLHELENNEQQAGQFICAIIDGNTPGVIEDLGQDILTEIEGDWTAVTSFIAAIPSFAPEVLQDIIQDGEDVVNVIGDIITDPEAAITIIENGVEAIVTDVEQVGEEIATFFEQGWCDLFGCPAQSSTPNPAATFLASCSSIMAAATTTYSPLAAYSTLAAQTSYYQTPAAATSTFLPAASSTITFPDSAQTSSIFVPPAETSSNNGGQAAQSTSTPEASPPTATSLTASGGIGSSGSDDIKAPVLFAWTGLIASSFIAFLFL